MKICGRGFAVRGSHDVVFVEVTGATKRAASTAQTAANDGKYIMKGRLESASLDYITMGILMVL